jgi:hypothetical protein
MLISARALLSRERDAISPPAADAGLVAAEEVSRGVSWRWWASVNLLSAALWLAIAGFVVAVVLRDAAAGRAMLVEAGAVAGIALLALLYLG